MVKALGKRIGADLRPRKLPLAEGSYLALDGVSDAPFVLCEAWAHIGGLRGAQPNKVLTDGFKLAFASTILSGNPL